ncbi:MAG: DUF4214 domain-containing protein [Lachnospiraceae bacterium]|nr:DUF4214 domain-containing protein [Lachnospiraceae bacterium]
MKNVSKKILRIIMMAFLMIVLMTAIGIPIKAKAALPIHFIHSGHSSHFGWDAISSDTALINLGKNGGSGYLTANIELSNNALEICSGKEVSLCLNGYSITQKNSTSSMPVIIVGENASLYLYDETGNSGKITHKTNCFGEGVRVHSGKFAMDGGDIRNNTSKGKGGGIYLEGNSEFTMTEGRLTSNRAFEDGGAIYIYDDIPITISGGTIENNVAGAGGGAIAVRGGDSCFTMNGGSIIGNTSDGEGGALSFWYGNFIMNGGYISDNTSKYSGGGIFAYNVNMIITDGFISDNTSENAGGGLCLQEGEFKMTGGTISGNSSGASGGGLSTDNVYVEITGGKISDNTAEFNGGGIFTYENTLKVTDGIISGNKVNGSGGGICTEDSYLIMTGGEVSNNIATSGAAMYLSTYESDYCGFTIDGGIIKQNRASQVCDGIMVYQKGIIIDGICEDDIDYDSETICYVKFNPNKGKGKAYTQYYQLDSNSKFTANRFTRSGYKFHSWNTKANGSGTSYADKAAAKGKPLVLYAQWKPNKYTVQFDANGGSGTMASQSIKYNTSTALNKNTFTKKGYAFAGWNTKADGKGTSYADAAKVKLTVLNTNKITLYAQWKQTTASYKVEHYRQKLDGTYPAKANETEELTGKANANVTPLVKTYKGFTAPATQTKKIKADGTLVVKYYYTRNSYKLTWDFAGGSAKGSYTNGTVKYGAKITAPTPVRDGYEFTGWDKTVASKMPANDLTYKAKWRKLSQEEQVRKFVERFYVTILDRPAEAAGLNDWTNRLISKQATGADVAAGFINSEEFQKKMTDEEYVTKLYRAFFDREPDKDGYNGWLRELKNGKTRDDVLRGFINSPEFNNLCKKYGINTGSY